MRKGILVVLAAVIGAAGFLLAQSEWEGTTAMARYGEFPATGLYGASNSFPRNTLVEVKNIENGASVTVLIVDRLDDPGLFLLLSREAAQKVGIADDQVVRTRIVLADNSGRLAVQDDDRPYSQDPDVNPGAAGELSFLDRYLESSALEGSSVVSPEPEPVISGPEPDVSGALIAEAEETVPEPEPAAEPEAEIPVDSTGETGPDAVLGTASPEESEEPVLSPPDVPSPLIAAEISVEPEAEPEAPAISGPLVEDLMARVPREEPLGVTPAEPKLVLARSAERSVDDLYNPEAPDGEVSYLIADLPETPAEKERSAVIAEQFPLPQPPYNGTESESFTALTPRLIEEARPAPVAVVEAEPEPPAEQPLPVEGSVDIVLEPAAPRPPEAPALAKAPEPVPETVAEPEPVEAVTDIGGDIPVTLKLDPQWDYLQLGVFSSPVSARSTAARFNGIYPVVVLNQDNALYKVLVGPLSSDESGALLLNFKAQGFRDAFVRKGF